MNFMAVSETKPEPQDRKLPVRRLLARANVYIAFASLLVIAEIASPAFLSGNNISNMLQQVAPLGIVVIGQTLVIVVRGLDLSVGSVMATDRSRPRTTITKVWPITTMPSGATCCVFKMLLPRTRRGECRRSQQRGEGDPDIGAREQRVRQLAVLWFGLRSRCS